MFRGKKLRLELCSNCLQRFSLFIIFISCNCIFLYRTKIFCILFTLVLRLKIVGSVTPPPPQVLVT